MIRVAAGERLQFAQKDVQRNGWAIECRINAEDPLRNFLPSCGRLVKFIPPPEIPGQVRVDTGIYEGGEVSMYYDSMIAKLICHGATRDAAITRMREALNAFVIRGVASNIAFQAALMQHPRFRVRRLQHRASSPRSTRRDSRRRASSTTIRCCSPPSPRWHAGATSPAPCRPRDNCAAIIGTWARTGSWTSARSASRCGSVRSRVAAASNSRARPANCSRTGSSAT